METNLAATTVARKERLIALWKRKQAAEQGNGANGGPYVPLFTCHVHPHCRHPLTHSAFNCVIPSHVVVSSHFAFKQRNFDPETRQLRRREAGESGDDTVEKAVEGLAEQIIREDEEKRKEELVRPLALVRYLA